jgi:anti-sigma-K factor RskA
VNDDGRLDLGALDPERDRARLDRSARAIAARLAPSLARRRARPADAWSLLAAWRTPVLATAAAIVVVSVVTLVSLPRTHARAASATVAAVTSAASSATASTSTSLSEAAGLPGAVASWVESDAPPVPSKTLDLQVSP